MGQIQRAGLVTLATALMAIALAGLAAGSVKDCNVAGMWTSTSGRMFICTDQKERWYNCFCLLDCVDVYSAFGGYYEWKDGACLYHRWNEDRQNGTLVLGHGGARTKADGLDWDPLPPGEHTCYKGCHDQANWTFMANPLTRGARVRLQ